MGTEIEVAPHPGDKFYEVPSYNMEGLQKKMAVLAKRAAKLGCEAPGFVEHAVVDTPEFEKDPLTWHIDGAMVATGKIRRSYVIEVTGSAPSYSGWDFLASVDAMPEVGNLVRVVPGKMLPEKYRTEAPHCDHCNAKRNRINHYVVRNKETGEFKMVGSGCIRDFLGHNSPENIAAMAAMWSSLDGIMEEARNGPSGLTALVYLDLAVFLSYVACAIGKFGWLSAGRANEEDRSGMATKNLAMHGMFHKVKECRDGCLHPTVEDKALAYTAISWAQDVEVKSDFDHNLKVLAQSEVLPYKGAGIAAAIIFCYKRSVEQELLREKRSKQLAGSVHVGEVGKRQEFTVTVVAERVVEGNYGATHIYKMVDEAGNYLTWFSSNGSLEEGESYVLKGTVKAHEEFRGTKQTTITRCKVVKEIAREVA